MYIDSLTLNGILLIIGIAAAFYRSRAKSRFNLKDLANYADQHHNR